MIDVNVCIYASYNRVPLTVTVGSSGFRIGRSREPASDIRSCNKLAILDRGSGNIHVPGIFESQTVRVSLHAGTGHNTLESGAIAQGDRDGRAGEPGERLQRPVGVRAGSCSGRIIGSAVGVGTAGGGREWCTGGVVGCGGRVVASRADTGSGGGHAVLAVRAWRERA
jgi:hypothetical protein